MLARGTGLGVASAWCAGTWYRHVVQARGTGTWYRCNGQTGFYHDSPAVCQNYNKKITLQVFITVSSAQH